MITIPTYVQTQDGPRTDEDPPILGPMIRRTLILGLAALSLGFAGCGDDEDGGGTGADTPPATAPAGAGAAGGGLTITADPGGQLAYTAEEVTAPAGPGKLTLVNDAAVPHDVIVEKDGEEVAKTDEISEDSATVDVNLESGEYTFYCSVGNHRGAGMEGTITVE